MNCGKALRATVWALVALVHVPDAMSEADVNLSGVFTSDREITCGSDTTVNLSGVTFADCSLKLRGDVTFTLNLVEGTTNVFRMARNGRECLKATKKSNIVFAGKGRLELLGETRVTDRGRRSGVLVCNDLTVKGGDIVVAFDADQSDTSCVLLKGSYLQEAGRMAVELRRKNVTNEFHGVTLDKRDSTFALRGGEFRAVIAGRKSRAVSLKKSSRAVFADGRVRAVFAGPGGRFVHGGELVEFSGGSYEFVADVGRNASPGFSPQDVRAVRAERAITVTGGVFRSDLPLQGCEVFSNDSKDGTDIVIRGGDFDLISGDDCFSANRDIIVSGGRIRGVSVFDDVLDANGNLTISGGYVQAFATAPGTHGLDVNRSRTLTVSGGVVIATDGLDATPIGAGTRDVGKTNFVQPAYYGTLTPAACGGKTLLLEGQTNGVAFALSQRLPAFAAGRSVNLLVSAPGRPDPLSAPKLEDAAAR